MGSLSNLYISQSFTSLLHLGNDGPVTNLAPGEYTQFQDGLGNSLGISVNSSGDISSSGYIYATNIFPTITTASFNQYTQSTNIRLTNIESTTASLNSSVSQLNASSASQQVSINNLNLYTASFSTASIATSITNLNTFTSSANIRLNNLETTSASVNVSISNLNSTTASQATSISNLNTSASLALTTASLSGQTLTFIKGNGSTFGIVLPDVSGSDITALNQFTASQLLINTGYNTFTSSTNTSINALNVFTASQSTASIVTSITNLNNFTSSANSRLNNIETTTASLLIETSNLETFSASVLVSISNLNQSSASQQISINALNVFTASQSTASLVTSIDNLNQFTQSAGISINALNAATSSYITESETASFARINIDNNFTANQTFTNITAVSASFTYVKTLYETASVIYSSGSNQFGDELTDIQTLSGSVKVQGSLTVNGTPVLTSSVDISGLVTTASFNQYTQSNNQRVSSLESNSASVNTSISNLNTATQSLFVSASLALVTASVNNDDITFTKGDGSQFTIQVATGSFAISASFADTASIARNVVITARNGNPSTLPIGTVVHITSAIGDNPVFNTASYDTELLSANTLGVLRQSAVSGTDVEVVVQGTVVSVNTDPTLGYAAGDVLYLSSSGQFTRVQPQAPNQIVVLGQVLRAQQNNGSMYVSINNGWELNELHNVQINNVQTGDLIQYESSSYGLWKNKSIVGAGITTTSSFNSYTSSTNSRLTNIESTTASLLIETQNLELFSASALVSISNLNTTTASLLVETQNLELFSASALTSLSNLNTATASLFTSASLSLTTASFSGNTLTFTKGDNSTFGVVIPDVSGSTINTASFATTGSNSFVGVQYITGSLFVSGTTNNDVNIIGRVAVTGPTTGQIPILYVSSSDASTTLGRFSSVVTNTSHGTGFSYSTNFGSFVQLVNTSGTKTLGLTLSGSSYPLDNWSSQAIFGQSGSAYTGFIGFQNGENYTDGRVTILKSLVVSGSADIQSTLTASLQEGYVWVGNASGITTTVATSSFGGVLPAGLLSSSVTNFVDYSASVDSRINSIVTGTGFATTGSNSFNGNQIITGSMTSSLDIRVAGVPIGFGNPAGTSSIAIGVNTLLSNTGNANIAIGTRAGQQMSTGGSNIGIGLDAIQRNTTGGQNVAVGEGALRENRTGTANTVIGHNAALNAGNVIGNTIVGRGATNTLKSNYNTIIGETAATNITSGSANTIVGQAAGADIGVGSQNIFIGQNAGRLISGSNNTLIGSAQGVGNWNSVIALSDGAGNIKYLNSGSQTTLTNNTLISGSLTTTGSATIGTILQLTGLDPLPAGATGQLAVSASLLWFYDATQWRQVSLV